MYARKIDALDAINHYPTINRFRNVIQRVDGSDIAESYSHDIDYFDFERNILSKHYTLDERKHNIFTCICISILYVYVYVYLYLSIHTHTHTYPGTPSTCFMLQDHITSYITSYMIHNLTLRT